MTRVSENPPSDAAALDGILAASPGPFSDAVLPNAFRDTPDVPRIHGAARKQLLGLVGHARRTGTCSLQVVTGDAGDGKTHILAWLRRTSEQGWLKTAEEGFALAPIAPLRSLDRPFSHVLQEAVWRLSASLPETRHTDTATDSPIEIVLWRALLAIVNRLQERPIGEPLRSRLVELLSLRPEKYFATFADQAAEVWPGIQDAFVDAALRLPELADADREIFRVLGRFPRPELRPDLLEWLGGATLAPERLAPLGAGITLEGEAEAARALRTLLLLATLARVPVVLAFDQIEGTARLGEEAVSDFLSALAELYNEGRCAVLLVFCQTQIWPKLRELAAGHVRDRLDATPPLTLSALTPDDGLALVEKRLEHFWAGAGAMPASVWYPFERDQVVAHLGSANLRTPRAVLRYFQALARDPAAVPLPVPAPPNPADLVRRKLDALIEEQARAPARSPEARAGIAQSMLREVLRGAGAARSALVGTEIEQVGGARVGKQKTAGTQLVVRRGAERRRVYVEVSNSMNGRSSAATARRLADALGSGIADRALLVRESAFQLPAAASAILAEITPRGAVVWLKSEEVVPLIALEALLNAAAAGDVAIPKDDALDLAMSVLGERDPGSTLAAVGRVLDAAFEAAAPAAPAAPESDVLEAARRIHEELRAWRAFDTVPRLAERLGAPVESVHAAVRLLAEQGVVELVDDRNRVPVALLRPEAV